jgi:hypothetical protein
MIKDSIMPIHRLYWVCYGAIELQAKSRQDGCQQAAELATKYMADRNYAEQVTIEAWPIVSAVDLPTSAQLDIANAAVDRQIGMCRAQRGRHILTLGVNWHCLGQIDIAAETVTAACERVMEMWPDELLACVADPQIETEVYEVTSVADSAMGGQVTR